MFQKSSVFVLIAVAIAVLGLAAMACSSDPEEAACDSEEDCSENEVCHDGSCVVDANNGEEPDVGVSDTEPADAERLDADSIDSGGDTGDEDGGHDTGQEDTGGADADTDADADDCEIELPCDRGVDDDVTDLTALQLVPEDDSADRYGCYDDNGDLRFVGVEDRVLNAQTCADELHRYRIRSRTCTAIDYLMHFEIKPKSDICPVGDFAEFFFDYDLASGEECQDGSDTECYEIHDTPDHGGARWTVRQVNVFIPDDDSLVDIRIVPDSGVNVPYELIIDIEEI